MADSEDLTRACYNWSVNCVSSLFHGVFESFEVFVYNGFFYLKPTKFVFLMKLSTNVPVSTTTGLVKKKIPLPVNFFAHIYDQLGIFESNFTD